MPLASGSGQACDKVEARAIYRDTQGVSRVGVSNLTKTNLKEAHSSTTAGHGGRKETSRKLSILWWPQLEQDVSEMVSRCEICQSCKTERQKPRGTMESFQVQEPNALVGIDLLGPITETPNLNRFIILAVDCFSRYVFARPAKDTGAATFKEFLVEYFATFGIPLAIRTDNAKTSKTGC